MITAAAGMLEIRVRANTAAATLAPASDILAIPLSARAATPVAANVRLIVLDEIITTTNLLEWRSGATAALANTENWADATNNGVNASNDGATTYQFRVKATDTHFASAIFTVTVAARVAGPAAVYNATTDIVSGGLTTAREWSIDGGNTWTNVVGTTITRAQIGTDDAVQLMIRTRATATVRAGLVTTVQVPAK
jgi:hypothetical protein